MKTPTGAHRLFFRLLLLTFLVAWPTRSGLAAAPKLVVANPAHDFGTVAQGQPLTLDYKISNEGDAVLDITEVQPTCGCTTTGDWPHHLKPGESGVIPIKMETAHFTGQVIKTVVIRSNDPAHPEMVVNMKATIWTPITLSNAVLVLPAISNPAEPATGSVTIRYEVDGKLALTDLQSDNPKFTPQLKEVAPGKEYELSVTTVPPLPEGTVTGKMTMKTNSEKMPELSVPVVATVPPAVQVAPTEISFTEPKLTTAEKRFAVILNHRGVDLQVSDIETNAPGVKFVTATTPDEKQFTITLTFPAGFQPRGAEPYYVRGKTNQPGVPFFNIPIVYVGGS